MKKMMLLVILTLSTVAHAGGPLQVTYTPVYPVDAKPITWASMPIHYRVDPGPLSSKYTNASAIQRVQAAFDVWRNVATANVSFVNDGKLAADVNTVTGFNNAMGACASGTLSPVVFDADGSIIKALGYDADVIAFAGVCKVDANGSAISGFAFLDGQWQDGVASDSNPEISAAEFDEAVTHELGHFLGLDHSQINVDAIWGSTTCDADTLAGLPLMFPYITCQARSTVLLPMLSPDDVAWISKLYPSPSFATSYGTISGYIYFADGVSQLQGMNVVARQVDDPATPQNESRRVAVSVVSGYLFTGNPGQSISAKYMPCNVSASGCPPSGFIGDNVGGGSSGSRNPALIGYYEIPVPPGTYTLQVENVNSQFTGGSSVGPVDPPVQYLPEGYWSESGFTRDPAASSISVSAGEKKQNINLVVPTGTFRFDSFEGPGAMLNAPVVRAEQASQEVQG